MFKTQSIIQISLAILTPVVVSQHSKPQLSLGDVESKNEQWATKYGHQVDLPFAGPQSFAHLTYTRCLDDVNHLEPFDIAILGMPFDTAVSYRPGARFGPHAIRSGSRRLRDPHGYTLAWEIDPYEYGTRIIDCGDVPVSPFDNALAIDQMEVAYSTLLARPVVNESSSPKSPSLDSKVHPRIVTLGGDHTIVLPILRSLHKVYGPISVIHFDAHLDTWTSLSDIDTEQSLVNHGTFFYIAAKENLMANNSVHAGIRCPMNGPEDIDNDEAVGFELITAEDIDNYGIPAVTQRIRNRIGDSPVYLSFDIDVLDPSAAPASQFFVSYLSLHVMKATYPSVEAGTPEIGGWTTREVRQIIRGLTGLNFVGADLVEVAPAYDHAEITGMAAAGVVHDFLAMMILDTPPAYKVNKRKRNRGS